MVLTDDVEQKLAWAERIIARMQLRLNESIPINVLLTNKARENVSRYQKCYAISTF